MISKRVLQRRERLRVKFRTTVERQRLANTEVRIQRLSEMLDKYADQTGRSLGKLEDRIFGPT